MSQFRARSLRRAASTGIVLASVSASLVLGLPPVTAQSSPGMVVAAVATPWAYSPDTGAALTYAYGVEFRAQPSMVESDIVVSRVGTTVVVTEEEGGPSLGIADPVRCTGDNPSGLSSEVTCSFPSAAPDSVWIAKGDFTLAPSGASVIVEEGSPIAAYFYGSAYDDYFQGGDLDDVVSGGGGDDNVYGGAGSDALWGGPGDDDMSGEAGDDRVWGDAGSDEIEGGPGLDSLQAGADSDSIDAEDGARDSVDCGSGEAAGANDVKIDAALDVTANCGGGEVPRVAVSPALSTNLPAVGDTVTGTRGTWLGTAPITYAYSFERCNKNPRRPDAQCTVVKKGTLDGQGLAEDRKPPSFKTTRTDQNQYLKYSVTATNAAVRGGVAPSAFAWARVLSPNAFILPKDWLPRLMANGYGFTQVTHVQAELEESTIGPFVDIVLKPVRRASVPRAMRKSVTHGGVIEISVDGTKLESDLRVEGTPDERPRIVITYYSYFEDRKVCPIGDEGIALMRGIIEANNGWPLPWLLAFLDDFPDGKCPWVIDWTSDVSAQNTFMATAVSLEETGDDDVPFRLRISASKPSTRPGLTMVIGAPPDAHVKQRPDDFSVGADGRLYAFSRPTHTSLWVGLLGDQVRESGKYGIVQLFLDGTLVLTESFQGTGTTSTPFSTVLTYLVSKPGKARVVVSTLANTPGPSQVVESQVFMDFEIAQATYLDQKNLVTWDGRCFTSDGVQGACPATVASELTAMRDAVSQSINGGLGTFTRPWDALRYASSKLDKRFVVIGANSAVHQNGAATSGARQRSCWWIDIFCHIDNAIQGSGQAVVRPRPPKPTPKPPPTQRVVVEMNVIPVGQDTLAGGVVGEGFLKVPGVGIVPLTGPVLPGSGGSGLLSDMGAAFTLETAELLGKAKLQGLEGATFVGIDTASVIGNYGGGVLSNYGAGFAPVVVVSLRQVP